MGDETRFSLRVKQVQYLGPGDHYYPKTLIQGIIESGAVSVGDLVQLPGGRESRVLGVERGFGKSVEGAEVSFGGPIRWVGLIFMGHVSLELPGVVEGVE